MSTKYLKVVITPRTNEASSKQYVKISTSSFSRPRLLPLDKPVWVTQQEVNALNELSELTSKKTGMTVQEIMDKYSVPEYVANEMAKDETMNKKVIEKKHYSVSILEKKERTPDEIKKLNEKILAKAGA